MAKRRLYDTELKVIVQTIVRKHESNIEEDTQAKVTLQSLPQDGGLFTIYGARVLLFIVKEKHQAKENDLPRGVKHLETQ
jgi:hypothetical protein